MQKNLLQLVTLLIACLFIVVIVFFQLELSQVRRELNSLKTRVPENQLSVSSAPEPVVEEPQERFYAVGTAIVRLNIDGTEDTLIENFAEKMETGVDGAISMVARPSEDTVIMAAGCWEGNSMRRLYKLDITQRTLTLMKSTARCHSYVKPIQGSEWSTYLIYPEKDRFIWVDLVEDTSKAVDILPKPYTYVQALDEAGYSEFIPGEIRWNGSEFETEVFDGNLPLELFERRLPIMKKNILDY